MIENHPKKDGYPMEINSLFPLIVTPSIRDVSDFYVKLLGFEAVFETDWYIQLHAPRAGGGKPVELAFMTTDLETQPAAVRRGFGGEGMVVTIELNEIDPLYDRARDLGCEVIVELRDESWGQRHFLVRDPAGVMLDIVKQIPPSKEFAAAYQSE